MESTNLHHLQDQHHHPPPPPPVSTTPYAVGGTTTTTNSWTPNFTLNNAASSFNSNNLQEDNPRSYSRSSLTHKKNHMIQDLGYQHHHQWTSTDNESSHNNLDSHEFSKNSSTSTIKEEISFANFPKFTEMLNYTTPNYPILPNSTTTQMKNINNEEHKDMNALMLKTLFTAEDFYNAQNYPNQMLEGTSNNNISSQIHPSINISNLNHYSSSAGSSSLDMNMQSLDLLTNSPTSLSQHSQDHHHHNLGRFTTHDHENLSFGLHPMQQPTNMSSSTNSINKPSLLSNVETKRGCTLMESKASQSQTALKKPRSSSEPRPSCPPFKVRKEKLGDRIASLQQLVAPFGKTDTASVLMEAIGYIKFLQGQVETLSVPYMKSSQNQNNRVMQGGSGTSDTNGEAKQDLRSRGLCLVPLSCMSYIAGDGCPEVWQQRPNFGGPA
ncbi:transcription factor bHLH110 [Trifolium pratense]|uniref:transcription factor bHLH110 n=1 Tax=Trifolium pratense TaxID=57577 RepID=UPI001E68FDB6|nr:transcription factor bHLH110 [Trifolium pratense]